MVGAIKSITSAVIGKRGAKDAYNAQLGGLNRAVAEQEGIFDDIKANQEGLRDDNIASIEGLRDSSLAEYDDAFTVAGDLLQDQYDQVSGIQSAAFDSQEARLIQNLDDMINRSEESFNYASENLMPYIQVGREAFNNYANKVNEGFNFDYKSSPGYDFIRDEALEASTNTAAASGMGLSGAAQKALADRAAGLAATDYDNQYRRAYGEYSDDLNRLSGLGNIGLSGDQTLINREQGLANFEVQAEAALTQALNENDMKKAAVISENILRLTGGQGQLAMQAAQIKNQINAGATDAIIGQRTNAANNIDNTRATTGTNIGNLEVGKGNAEANYQNTKTQLQSQLAEGVIDAGAMIVGGVAGGTGAIGGASGLTGAVQGMNFGGQFANMGAGSPLSPQATNYITQQPQQMSIIPVQPSYSGAGAQFGGIGGISSIGGNTGYTSGIGAGTGRPIYF